MKNFFVMLFCIFAFSDLFATEQAAIILLYENNEFSLRQDGGILLHWNVFLQNHIDSPFEMLSTGNYRGLSHLEICNNKLYITKIDDTKARKNVCMIIHGYSG
jgi:hypothetical protein